MQFIRGLMNAIFDGRRRSDRWLEQHYRVQGNTLALQDAEKRVHVCIPRAGSDWTGRMGRWDVSCMRVKAGACMYMYTLQRDDDAVMVRCWWCWCWSGMCRQQTREGDKVKRDYALGQIGNPRVELMSPVPPLCKSSILPSMEMMEMPLLVWPSSNRWYITYEQEKPCLPACAHVRCIYCVHVQLFVHARWGVVRSTSTKDIAVRLAYMY
jgi:hypothetical protein